jgi:hypothetical protein
MTYERAGIEKWLKQSTKSPVTNLPLQNLGLRPNHALRNAIEDWLALAEKRAIDEPRAKTGQEDRCVYSAQRY